MPPPLPTESDAESNAGDVKNSKLEPDAKMEDVDEEEEDDEEDEETFIVEAIHDHRSDFEDGQLRYQVKWKGYEKKADRTWETEENLEGAKEVLEEYLQSIGGRPDTAKPKQTKKRGRQSNASVKATPDTSAKKQRTTSKGGRKSNQNGALEQDVDHSGLIGYTEVGDDDWKVPPPKEGTWDPLVQSIDTVVREASDGELWGYLIWNEKNDEGRFYRSRAKLPTIYKCCPQRMLHFYEKHLVFSTGTDETAGEDKGAS